MANKIVRLEVGSLEGEGTESADKGYYEKPVMMVYTGKFKSLDGDVEIKDEDIDKLVSNHNSILSKLSRLATGEVPLRHNPPLQLDHSTSARDTVGRLVGPIKAGEYEHEGEKKKAMFGTCRFLGADNIEHVKDGRWAHVSIGADLENHKLTELSITPFPAAADASLLKRLASEGVHKDCDYKVFQQDGSTKWVWETKYKSGVVDSESAATTAAKACIDENIDAHPNLENNHLHLSGVAKMSFKETKEKMSKYEKCRKHLTGYKAMSEEDADKHLEGMKDDELTAMAAECDDHEKKMADEAAKEHGQLKAHKGKLVALSKGMKATGAKVQLAEAKTKISVRLGRLKAEGKISPAEIKGMDLDALAGKGADVVEATLSSYEKREHIIDTGLVGSTKALTPSQIARLTKDLNMETEELQTRLNMGMKREDAVKRMKELEDKRKRLSEMQPEMHAEPDGDEQKLAAFESAYAEHQKLVGEGKHDEAKEHLRKHLTSVHAGREEHGAVTDPTPTMSALAQDFKKMQTDFEELVKLAAPAFGATTEELT